ncbi:MAG: glycosyltransferase family 4 protein [bacterium]|nr:glycosyltransferase family 4 protein [bacterium]
MAASSTDSDESRAAPVKICFDARMIGSSGIGTQIQNVLRLLMKQEHIQLHLLGNPRDIFRHLPGFGGKITEFKSSIYSIGEQLFFPRPAPDEILHVPHYNAPIRYLRRSVIVLHDLIHLQSTQFAGPHYRAYAYVMLWLVSRFARRVATVSDTTRREFLSRFPVAAARTSVVYNGIDHRLLKPQSEKDVKAFRKSYGLPARFMLVIGIGKRHKNVDFAVRALAREWKSGRCRVPLVLGGTGGKIPDYIRETLEREGVADRLLVVPFLRNEELPLLYAAAEVFILPSLYEGFGFPLVEAMACGTPAITSRASCLPEIGSDAALYFDPRDADDFIKTLYSVLDDPKLRDKMIRTGIKRAKDYDWKKHVEQLTQIYESLNPAGPVRGS